MLVWASSVAWPGARGRTRIQGFNTRLATAKRCTCSFLSVRVREGRRLSPATIPPLPPYSAAAPLGTPQLNQTTRRRVHGGGEGFRERNGFHAMLLW